MKKSKKKGWQPYYIPEDVSLSTRMHLDKKKVKILNKILSTWLKSEELKPLNKITPKLITNIIDKKTTIKLMIIVWILSFLFGLFHSYIL